MYEWHKPVAVPRHDELDAGKKLIDYLIKVVQDLGSPEPEPPCKGMRIAWSITHPDLAACLLHFLIFRDIGTNEVPVMVEVLPPDTARQRGRVYSFRADGTVCVDNPQAERAAATELKPKEEWLLSWPEGVRHMFLHLALALRQSADWETRLAENLEIMAPRP